MKFFKFLMIIVTLFAPYTIFAHPGHGDHSGFTITHYFTEPEHIALLILIVSAIVVFAVRRKKATGK